MKKKHLAFLVYVKKRKQNQIKMYLVKMEHCNELFILHKIPLQEKPRFRKNCWERARCK